MPLWNHPDASYEESFPLNSEFRAKGIYQAIHLFHLEESRWMTPKELLDWYSLPKGHYLKAMQLLTFHKARLKDLSIEKSNTTFDDLLSNGLGRYGVSTLYRSLRKKFTRVSHDNMFQFWGTLLEDPVLPRKILECMQSLRKNVICEAWRETLFKIAHRALYGFIWL